MKVIVTGGGQLAWELARAVPAGIELIALPRAALDLAMPQQIARQLSAHQPAAVINAAAYTAVDKAESDREAAFAVNADGVGHLAVQCKAIGAYLLHVSTDFVFDGSKSTPYAAEAEKAPLGVYGESKAEGEDAIAATLAEDDWAIIRTAWVYSEHGNNFVKTMLRLMAEKPALGVVGDQVGTPTWAKGLAEVCWATVLKRLPGIYHWTDLGVASWYDFAVAIQRAGLSRGLLKQAIPVNSIRTEQYPTPAKRPAYSVLDKSKLLTALDIPGRHWQAQLEDMMSSLAAQAR